MRGLCNFAAAFVGLGIGVAGLLMLAYQILFWLFRGHWPSLRLGLAWEALVREETYLGWRGSSSIMSLISDLPLAGILFFLGLLTYIIAILNVERTVKL